MATFAISGREMVRNASEKKKKMMMNKRGSLIDILYVVVVVFVFGIASIFGLKILVSFNDEVSTMSDIPANAINANDALEAHYGGVMDNMTMFLLIGFGISALIMASLVRIHPAFFFIYFIMLIIVIVISGVLANVYGEISEDANMAGLSDTMFMTTHIIQYLPIIVGVLGTALAIVMYQGWKNDN